METKVISLTTIKEVYYTAILLPNYPNNQKYYVDIKQTTIKFDYINQFVNIRLSYNSDPTKLRGNRYYLAGYSGFISKSSYPLNHMIREKYEIEKELNVDTGTMEGGLSHEQSVSVIVLQTCKVVLVSKLDRLQAALRTVSVRLGTLRGLR